MPPDTDSDTDSDADYGTDSDTDSDRGNEENGAGHHFWHFPSFSNRRSGVELSLSTTPKPTSMTEAHEPSGCPEQAGMTASWLRTSRDRDDPSICKAAC